ncbi:MAG TPA: hypothetical protein VGN72_09300 [Tepidisphaeraceae bacterium]|jgi:membrane-bound serine protease (ClpP class)|nr:hypothetical protein [Tepidisphaeraceae bacterium]
MRNACFAILVLMLFCFGRHAVAQTAPAATSPAATTMPATTAPVERSAVVIGLSGTVDNYNRDTLKKRFEEARELGAHTVILEVDTYGGAVTAALDISRFLKQQNDLHTIAFVSEKAISAGVMIAMAADELVMAPGAMIGDSAPIAMGGGGGMQPLPAAERAKAESPILADFYDSAIRNGYEPLLAEAMVSVGRAVYWVENGQGQRKFVGPDEYKSLKDAGWTDVPGVPVPVDAADTLLTVGTDLAAKLGLAKAVYPSIPAMVADRNLTVIATLQPAFGEKVMGWLSSDALRGVLMVVLMLSLYAALNTPGTGGPEAVAAICLSSLLVVPLLTGYAQWWEVIAILLGLVLIAMEIFVIPGFGIPGITGLVLVLCGLLMTFVPLEPGSAPIFIPSLAGTWQAVQTGLMAIVGAMLASIGLSFWMRRFLPRMPYFSRLILTDVAGGGGVMGTNPTLGNDATAWPTIAARGYAVSDLRPGGVAKFHDDAVGTERTVNVVSDSGFVSAGSAIAVHEVGGNRVVVRPVGGTA